MDAHWNLPHSPGSYRRFRFPHGLRVANIQRMDAKPPMMSCPKCGRRVAAKRACMYCGAQLQDGGAVLGLTGAQWLERGFTQWEREQWDAGAKTFENAAKADPSSPDAWIYWAFCLARLNKPHDALGVLRQGAARLPESVPVTSLRDALQPWLTGGPDPLLECIALLRAGNVALAQLHAELSLCPPATRTTAAGAMARSYLGRCYQARGFHDHAMREFRTALSLDPAYAYAHQGIGTIFAHGGRYRQALAAFTEAVELAPRDPALWSDKGCAFRQLGYHGDGLACFERALEVNPQHVEALENRSNVFLCACRWPDAIAGYEDVLRLMPSHAQAREALEDAKEMHAKDSKGQRDKPILDLPPGEPGPTLISMASHGREGAWATQVLGRLRTEGTIARAEDILCANWRLDVPPIQDLPSHIAPYVGGGVLANGLTRDRRAYSARWADGRAVADERDLSTGEMHQWLRLQVAGVLSEVVFIASEPWSDGLQRSLAQSRAVLQAEGIDGASMQLRRMEP